MQVNIDNTASNRKRSASQASSSDSLHSSDNIFSPSPPSRELREEARGEMTRIRTQWVENQMALTLQVDAGRPDYLKRAKRRESPTTLYPDRKTGQRVTAPIGVTKSPIKARQLMLFHETSDESFEESLMAGGYDHYQSAIQGATDLELPQNFAESKTLPPPVPSEQELRKINRLSAFRSSSQLSFSRSQLIPVDVEGCGRVLINIGPSDPQSPSKLNPSKKKHSRKKKKLPFINGSNDRSTFLSKSEASGDVPNWPDTQFPWRLRFEQCDDYLKMEEEQRLQYIENFLTRDSDDEDHEDILLQNQTNRRRGPAMISIVPGDPADARTALLSKQSIRRSPFRRSPRNFTDAGSDDEIVCTCRGSDDGRELVQCDGCHTWYHLQCIGIQSIEDLGREEDPWFCDGCVKTPASHILQSSQPTFVPTEEKLKHDKSYNPPFFHAGLKLSPASPWGSSSHPPMTPPGRTVAGPYFSSGSSWDESSSQRGPQTPQFSSQSVRVYSGTPAYVEPFMAEESPFDPTSTPSRGIRFGAPFATPKNQFLQGRGPELFNISTRPNEDMSSHPPFGQHLAGGAEDDWHLPIFSSGSINHDITPIGCHSVTVGSLAESPLAAKRSRRGPGGGRFLDHHHRAC